MKSKLLFSIVILTALLITSAQPAQAQWFTVRKSDPQKGQKDVPLDKMITITFSEPLHIININSNLLVEMPSKSPVPANLTYSDDFRTMYITPKSLLKRGTYYVISLAGIKSAKAKEIYNYQESIDFTTVGGQFFCVAYATPSEVFISPGGFKDVVYSFIEQGGGWGEIMRCQIIYEDANGRELLRNTEEMKLILPDKQTTKLSSAISMPADLGKPLLGQTIHIRRIFEGLDHDNNKITIRTGVKATVGEAPSVAISSSNSITVRAPEYGAVIPRDSIIPIEGIIKWQPGSEVHGCWLFNGSPMGFFAATVPASGELKQTISDRAFAQKDGRASVALQMISPDKKTSEKVEYIVSSSPLKAPIIMEPKEGSIFKKTASAPPTVRWSMVQGAISYKIAISANKSMSGATWISADNNFYTPDWVKWSSFGAGTMYCSVKPIYPDNREGEQSAPISFSISE